ncbi:MAG: hypothetical protein FWB96_03665 [Defluviitaleaceae bacterium]|nr:hypothetical protein [Defluviitaleaceae bacterium]MCL2262150.1 hypothetical protein [Defluviitaleaceae bacterium]
MVKTFPAALPRLVFWVFQIMRDMDVDKETVHLSPFILIFHKFCIPTSKGQGMVKTFLAALSLWCFGVHVRLLKFGVLPCESIIARIASIETELMADVSKTEMQIKNSISKLESCYVCAS